MEGDGGAVVEGEGEVEGGCAGEVVCGGSKGGRWIENETARSSGRGR